MKGLHGRKCSVAGVKIVFFQHRPDIQKINDLYLQVSGTRRRKEKKMRTFSLKISVALAIICSFQPVPTVDTSMICVWTPGDRGNLVISPVDHLEAVTRIDKEGCLGPAASGFKMPSSPVADSE